jgi:Undecaprenyl-phosphate glucose phosphotransferase
MSHSSQVPELAGASPVRIWSKTRLISYRTVGQVTAVFDYLLIVAACITAAFSYHYLVLSQTIAYLGPYLGLGSIAAIIFVLLSLSHGLYRPTSLISFQGQIRGILFNWMVVLLIISLMFFLLKIGASRSRGTLTLFGLLGFVMLFSSRCIISAALNNALARGTLGGYPAIIIGDFISLERLSNIQILQRFGAHEMDRFELPGVQRNVESDLAVIDQAIESARSNRVEWVLVAVPWSDERRRNVICERLQLLPLPVALIPDPSISSILSRPVRHIGSDFTIEVQRAPLSSIELAMKRAVDLVLGGGLLVAFAPLLALVGLLIKADSPGPVIFRQRRKGFNGHQFTIFKFRTMSVLEDGDVVAQAQRNDARITRLGRLLRATSIDELPQLINVLQGQMSLVGPRPHAVAHDNGYAKLIAHYAFRQHVKPGLTGWAQVHGFRGETAQLELMERRVALDLWYTKNWSIWLDLRIIVLTCFELIRRQDAY